MSRGSPLPLVSGPALDSKIGYGMRFLLQGRCSDGLWRDFRTRAGPGSDWVSGFVCYALLQSDPPGEATDSVLSALVRRQSADGGWSYNKTVPNDCDSTSWVLLALVSGGALSQANRQRACDYVMRHQDPAHGGFSTYTASDGIGSYIGAPSEHATRGWTSAHTCVSGVALQALLVAGLSANSAQAQHAVTYLLETLREDGLWRSYWWTGCTYATFHALRALTLAGAADEALRRRVGLALLARQSAEGGWGAGADAAPSGEPFETAFALLALTSCSGADHEEASQRAARWLLLHGVADGSWPSTPVLRIPAPMIESPSKISDWRVDRMGTSVVIRDEGRLFTTAAVIQALAAYRASLSQG